MAKFLKSHPVPYSMTDVELCPRSSRVRFLVHLRHNILGGMKKKIVIALVVIWFSIYHNHTVHLGVNRNGEYSPSKYPPLLTLFQSTIMWSRNNYYILFL